MKAAGALIFSWLALGVGAVCAGEWTVRMKVVDGRATYSHTQAGPLGEQVNFSGKPLARGGGPARELIFNTLLNKPEDGFLRLDYQVELGGRHRARPPFQAQGKVLLRPGKPVLVAGAGGFKFIAELRGAAEGKPRGKGPGKLETALKCGRVAYPASFVYLPDEQYSAVLYGGTQDEVRRFMVGLLPNGPALDGTFLLQYTLELKEGGETLAGGQGELVLAPGGGWKSAAAGKACLFSARALR